MKAKEIIERGALTAGEAGLAVLVASGSGWVAVDVWKGAGVAFVAAALSFALNTVRSLKAKASA